MGRVGIKGGILRAEYLRLPDHLQIAVKRGRRDPLRCIVTLDAGIHREHVGKEVIVCRCAMLENKLTSQPSPVQLHAVQSAQ